MLREGRFGLNETPFTTACQSYREIVSFSIDRRRNHHRHTNQIGQRLVRTTPHHPPLRETKSTDLDCGGKTRQLARNCVSCCTFARIVLTYIYTKKPKEERTRADEVSIFGFFSFLLKRGWRRQMLPESRYENSYCYLIVDFVRFDSNDWNVIARISMAEC